MKSFIVFIKERYKKYSHSGEGFGQPIDPREPFRGPHEGREHLMMLAGVKPAALVSHERYQKHFAQHVASGRFIAKPVKFGGTVFQPSKPDMLVGLKGEEYRINKLHKEFGKPGRDHVKIGRLLGYTKDHIRTWMKGQ